MRITLITALSIAAILIAGFTASAEVPCADYKSVNITKGFRGNSTSPSISADGRFVAFQSQTEITQENPGGTYQIFVYDSLTGEIKQITRYKDEGSVAPSISGDGAYVAFVSGADIDGSNPDGLNLIYLFEIKSGKLTQVTTKGDSFEPSVSYGGSQVVFSSNMESGDESSNIFLYENLNATTTEISDSSEGWSTNPEISGSGKYAVFQSTPEITGPGAGKSSELYLYDVVSGSAVLVELSDTQIGNISPSINADGRIVAFQSDSNSDGENLKGAFNIYLYNSEKGNLTKITKEPDAGSAGPSVNGNGTLVAFQSLGNFTGNNQDGNLEIFLFDSITSAFKQITDTESNVENTGARISADGSSIVFVFDDSSLESNPEQKSDVYLATCAGGKVAGKSPEALNWVILAAAIVLVLILLGKFGKQKKS